MDICYFFELEICYDFPIFFLSDGYVKGSHFSMIHVSFEFDTWMQTI